MLSIIKDLTDDDKYFFDEMFCRTSRNKTQDSENIWNAKKRQLISDCSCVMLSSVSTEKISKQFFSTIIRRPKAIENAIYYDVKSMISLVDETNGKTKHEKGNWNRNRLINKKTKRFNCILSVHR